MPLRWLSAATRLPDEALTICGKTRYFAPLRHHAPLRRGVDHANSALHCSAPCCNLPASRQLATDRNIPVGLHHADGLWVIRRDSPRLHECDYLTLSLPLQPIGTKHDCMGCQLARSSAPSVLPDGFSKRYPQYIGNEILAGCYIRNSPQHTIDHCQCTSRGTLQPTCCVDRP